MKKFLTLIMLYTGACTPNYITKSYEGTPWKKQTIPGKIECEWYDKGGESVAYHDTDAVNNGSGKLNPANGSFLNEFRMQEGVDISYTKSHGIDDNPYNESAPLMNQLYVGWTQPGEWINYSIRVKKTGSYRVAIKYTANGEGAIGFDLDGKKFSGPFTIISTHNDTDTVKWRQWHHWNKIDSLTTMRIQKGIHMLTLHIIDHGNMNFDYLEFSKE